MQDIYAWVKDDQFQFISCSENLCALAGEDSPYGMIGKDDFSLIWQKDAKVFRENDIKIIKGELKYINRIETICTSNIDKQKILITKIPLINAQGTCIGIAGSHINLPLNNNYTKGNLFDEKGRLYLSSYFGNAYLTKKEVGVLRLILLGNTSKNIAKILRLSYRTIEEHTSKIKKKLQCTSKNQIHYVAIEYGLIHLL